VKNYRKRDYSLSAWKSKWCYTSGQWSAWVYLVECWCQWAHTFYLLLGSCAHSGRACWCQCWAQNKSTHWGQAAHTMHRWWSTLCHTLRQVVQFFVPNLGGGECIGRHTIRSNFFPRVRIG
jgi:hypothetical protein